jgi:predicted RNase H-like HicB family nuclease
MPHASGSLGEVTERIREAIELCLEWKAGTALDFVGIQRVTIAA